MDVIFRLCYIPFPKIQELKDDLVIFIQGGEESFSSAWERYKEKKARCPYGVLECVFVSAFNYSLRPDNRAVVDKAAWGSLMKTIIDITKATYESLAKKA